HAPSGVEYRRGWLVARRRRRAEYALAAGAQSHVLGGVADRPAERAGLCASPQWVRRNAAVWQLSVERRRQLPVGNPAQSHSDRREYRADRHSVLGHGYRGLRADQGIDRRALRALVSVRRLQYAVPFARAHL